MPPKQKWPWAWIKKDIAYIEMMEQYENKDAFATKRSKQNEVWQEISVRSGMPARYCRIKWTRIKHNYLQLKYMINIGRVTEDMVRNNIKTSKYLDGRLDFLDRFMFKIPEANLSSSSRNFFDSAFGVFSHTQSGSSVEKLIKVKENSVIEVIKDYKQEIGKEPMSILPNIEIYESDNSTTHCKETFVNSELDQAIKEIYRIEDDSSDILFTEPSILPDTQINTSANEEFVHLGIDQAIKEDYLIDDDLNNVQFVAPNMIPNTHITQEDPIGDNVVTNVTSSTVLKDIVKSTKNKDIKSSKPISENSSDLAVFLVKYTNMTIDKEKDKDSNLKEYMNDLAEVLCRRLAPGKRKYFLSQIDLLVSEILEGP